MVLPWYKFCERLTLKFLQLPSGMPAEFTYVVRPIDVTKFPSARDSVQDKIDDFLETTHVFTDPFLDTVQ